MQERTNSVGLGFWHRVEPSECIYKRLCAVHQVLVNGESIHSELFDCVPILMDNLHLLHDGRFSTLSRSCARTVSLPFQHNQHSRIATHLTARSCTLFVAVAHHPAIPYRSSGSDEPLHSATTNTHPFWQILLSGELRCSGASQNKRTTGRRRHAAFASKKSKSSGRGE